MSDDDAAAGHCLCSGDQQPAVSQEMAVQHKPDACYAVTAVA
jgi:hypothetical protein